MDISHIQLIFPSHAMPFSVPFSLIKELESRINTTLRDIERSSQVESASSLDYPSPGSWVLVDVANASIIHKIFLRSFVVSGGYYMVLSMRASTLSEEQLLEKIEALNIRCQTIIPRTMYQFPLVKLVFPSHCMPFVIPLSKAEWLERVIDLTIYQISKNVDTSEYAPPPGSSSQSSGHHGTDVSIFEFPSGGDWVLVDTGNSSIIHKSFLGAMLVDSKEYMVLPMRASAMSMDDLELAIVLTRSRSISNGPQNAPSSSTVSSQSSGSTQSAQPIPSSSAAMVGGSRTQNTLPPFTISTRNPGVRVRTQHRASTPTNFSGSPGTREHTQSSRISATRTGLGMWVVHNPHPYHPQPRGARESLIARSHELGMKFQVTGLGKRKRITVSRQLSTINSLMVSLGAPSGSRLMEATSGLRDFPWGSQQPLEEIDWRVGPDGFIKVHVVMSG